MSNRATVRLRVGWDGRYAGVFTVAHSLVAPLTTSPGYDTIGDVLGSPTYGGTYDTIPDGRYGCTTFTLVRGRDDPQSNMLAGQLEATLNDIYPGRYNPKNAASVLWDSVNSRSKVRPMRPCKLDATVDGGLTYMDLFSGYLDESSCNVDIGTGEAKLVFKDMFLWLDRAKNITLGPTGPTNVGTVINSLLDSIGWSPTNRNIALGAAIPDFSVTPGTSALTAIANLLEVDLGVFFVNRSGTPTYYNRYQSAVQTSIGIFNSVKTAIPGVALSSVKNSATVTRQFTVSGTLTDSTPQTYEDSASKSEFGPASWDEVKSPYINTDGDALSLATIKVVTSKDPLGSVWNYTVSEGESSGRNLIGSLDSDMESATFGNWPSGLNQATLGRATPGTYGLPSISGLYGMLVTATAAGGTTASACQIHTPLLPGVKIGHTYSSSVYVSRLSGVRRCTLFIQWYDVGINLISTVNGAEFIISNTGWTRVVCENVVAPPGATQALLIISFWDSGGTNNIGDLAIIDGAQVEEGLTSSMYDNGSFQKMLQADILDRATVSAFGTSSDYHIQKITLRGGAGVLYQADWALVDRAINQPFLVGVSLVAPATNSAGYDRVWY